MSYGSRRSALLNICILWNIPLSVLVNSYWHFEGSKFLHIQVQAVQDCWKRRNISEDLALSYGVI
jgi:hypothetical protein